MSSTGAPCEDFRTSSLTPIRFDSDYECFTLLAQHGDVQALQVLNAAGEWIQASPKPGTFVVNIGDQLQRITSTSRRACTDVAGIAG